MQVNNEKVKEKSEGKGVGKVGESLLVASPNSLTRIFLDPIQNSVAANIVQLGVA